MNKEEAIEILDDLFVWIPWDDSDTNDLQKVINWLKETEQ